ncbi:MAG TPA: carbamoyltransferase HypF [Vicinamibacterales bacterium]
MNPLDSSKRPAAERLRVRGIVQGVGFRPFVYRLAADHALGGWVLNDAEGVEIHVEGAEEAIRAFARRLHLEAPPAAAIVSIERQPAPRGSFATFEIRESAGRARPTTRISPDLPVCAACLAELRDASNARHQYPYITCTHCGPRYSIVRQLPYDRPRTTMAPWPLCVECRAEYENPANRRFHAQPVACPSCGPHYRLEAEGAGGVDAEAVAATVRLLRAGAIVAIKGIGGYHLACDARQPEAVRALRERKFRKERPFALMVPDDQVMATLVELSSDGLALARSAARPILLAPARVDLPGVSPDNGRLGVMLPSTPVHHMLFDAGAPDVLVMTSGNRSSEPIAYEDDDARARLAGLADAWLVGERPIARRLDDSVVQETVYGRMMIRRARGYAPGAVARLPTPRPILALGADLKNSITLVVGGEAFVSQHIGDLEQAAARDAFERTIADLLAMYGLTPADTIIAHDAHPAYTSSQHAAALPAEARLPVSHHRAHVASVLAEHDALDTRVVGAAFDGTGYGDDGSIWGGELFVGSVFHGFSRVGHLREAWLPGGDAAARFPAQAVAGFTADLEHLGDLLVPPFSLPTRYEEARRLVANGMRTFRTTSVGRLFDAVAALLGFRRPMTFEGQAAIWLEQLALRGRSRHAFACPFLDGELDFRPALTDVIESRRRGWAVEDVARAFHRGLANGLAVAMCGLARTHAARAFVLSGGVFQNALLLSDLKLQLDRHALPVWMNRQVPPNDGGISLGQAAIAAAWDGAR